MKRKHVSAVVALLRWTRIACHFRGAQKAVLLFLFVRYLYVTKLNRPVLGRIWISGAYGTTFRNRCAALPTRL